MKHTSRGKRSTEPLRVLTILVLFLLVAQFLVGMAVNLFVQIPNNHPGARPVAYFSGSVHSVTWALTGAQLPGLMVHVVIGIILLLAAVALLPVAIRDGGRGPAVASGFGLIGIIFAGFNGASFLDFNQDVSSMLMSCGLALAMTAYSASLYVSGRSRAGGVPHSR